LTTVRLGPLPRTEARPGNGATTITACGRTAFLLSLAPLRGFFPIASLSLGGQGNISRRTRHLSPRAVACRPCNGSVDEGGRRQLSRAPPCRPPRSRDRQTQSDRSQPLCPPPGQFAPTEAAENNLPQ